MIKQTGFGSEAEIINYIQTLVKQKQGVIGIGDDAAVVEQKDKIVVTTDSLVENVHFKKEWVNPMYLGRKAVLTNFSDIAAMGAIPKYVLVSLILPSEYLTPKFIKDLYLGFEKECAAFDAIIVGGNISKGQHVSITLTVIGEVEGKVLTRRGAYDGDLLFVTGELGRSAKEIKELLSRQKKQANFLPESRVFFGHQLSRYAIASACIDVSDSLTLDLERLCSASKVGVILYEDNLPVMTTMTDLLFGGEDYELLFTIPRSKLNLLYAVRDKTRTPIHFIGKILENIKGIYLENKAGIQTKLIPKGWDHLKP